MVVAVENDDEAEDIVFRLSKDGYEVGAIVENDATGRLATARVWSPVGDESHVFVDLLFSSSGIEHEIARDAAPTEVLPGLVMPVAQIGHLIAAKLLSVTDRRPQDAVDLEQLREVADAGELERAKEAVTMIMQRGTNRGRDLPQALEELISRSG